MWIYIFILAILILIGMIGLCHMRYRGGVCFFSSVIIILLSGLRWERWSDWDNYYKYFNGTADANDFELGFKIFVTVLRHLLVYYNLYLIFLYSLVLFLFYYVSKKKCTGYEPLVIIYVYSSLILPSGGQRQFIATAIYVFATMFLMQCGNLKDVFKKNLFYYVLCIVAGLFHRTAFIGLIFPLFMFIFSKIKVRELVIVTTIGVVANKFMSAIFDKMIPFIARISPSTVYRMNLYRGSGDDTAFFSLSYLKHFIILVFIIYCRNYCRTKCKNDSLNIYYSLLLFGSFLALAFDGQFERVKVFFYACESIAVGLSLRDLVSQKKNRLLFVFI